MKLTMNITTCSDDTHRFSSQADLQGYFRKFSLDGLEVMEMGPDEDHVIFPEDTVGVHLRSFSAWMDLWTENKPRLEAEFGDDDAVDQVFGGHTREALIQAYLSNLAFANTMEPEYLVFHVSECTIAESMFRRYYYTDEQVCDGAAELLNQITDHITGTPWLLLENLWYAGLTLQRPELVDRLLSRIRYPKVGIMMDTGHLMHTNPDLQTPDQAVDYMHRILDGFSDLSPIRGMHLHQSFTGDFARQLQATWQPTTGTYNQRMWKNMENIFRLDSHEPFCSSRIREIWDRLPNLDYVTLEEISCDRAQHDRMLTTQMAYLNPVLGR